MPDADVLVHAGDITSNGEMSTIKDFADWMSGLPYKHKLCVAGNRDWNFSNHNKIESLELFEKAGITYLQDSSVIIDDLKFYGNPHTPFFYAWAFNLQRGKDIAMEWAKIPSDVSVLISHGPPFGILDEVPRGFGQFENAGCKDLLDRITQLKNLKFSCHGHLHESRGTLTKNGIQFVNASICNGRYEPINEPILIEI